MQKLVPSDRRHTWSRSLDVDEHIENLRAEFADLPGICHTHAELIVRIRRKIDLESSLAAFFDLWSANAEELALSLTSRWLVSACDTFADYGTPVQQARALILSGMINTLKLAETERLLARDAALDPAKADVLRDNHQARVHIDLWDGMTAYSIASGDMPRNLLARIRSVLDDDPVLGVIGSALIERALESDTVFGRLAKLNPRFARP